MSTGKKIKIAGYVYKDGVRKEHYFCDVFTERYYNYSVEYKKGGWFFKLGDFRIRMDGKLGFWKMMCYVYFGGKSTSPVTMQIEVT